MLRQSSTACDTLSSLCSIMFTFETTVHFAVNCTVINMLKYESVQMRVARPIISLVIVNQNACFIVSLVISLIFIVIPNA